MFVSTILLFVFDPSKHLYIVSCQGGGVSSKTRRRGADKTRSLNPLVR